MHKQHFISEIDGLRALAILLVVVFHFFPNILVAGFIGVDVFFVISGFVISRLILTELETGHFSFIQFYKKRIIRIFPALLLVMVFCLILGWLTLFQDELLQLSKHILSGIFFYTNFTLLDEVNYFDQSASHKILLNLWSLAIEEQFYIIWPICLVLFFRTGRYCLLSITLLITLSSFWFNVTAVHELAEKAFYLPTCRIWQLLAGALLSIVEQNFSQLNNVKASVFLRRGILGNLGLLAILLSAIFIPANIAYPGYWALLPTIASACVIYQLLVFPDKNIILKHPVLVGIGKISYPLYLWHWPLLAFLSIFGFKAWIWHVVVLTLSLLLAYLTYTFVEYPIRFVMQGSKRMGYLLFSMLIVASISFVILLSNGAKNRAANKWFVYYQQAQHETSVRITCNRALGFVNSLCISYKPYNKVDAVILGDSHASALYFGFANNLAQKNLNLLHLGRIGCPYLPDVDWTKKKEPSCAQYTDIKNAYLYILSNPDIQHVVLAMRWKNYANDTTGRFSSLKDPTLVRDKLLLNTLNKTINTLNKAGKKVYIVQTVPDVEIKKCLRRALVSISQDCKINLEQYQKENATFEKVMGQLQLTHPYITYYSTLNQICNLNKECSIMHNQKLLYKDGNHLSEYGAQTITRNLADQISQAHETIN